jgi:hypothetical protein
MALTADQKKAIQIITTNTPLAYRQQIAASDAFAIAELHRVVPGMIKQMQQTVVNMALLQRAIGS